MRAATIPFISFTIALAIAYFWHTIYIWVASTTSTLFQLAFISKDVLVILAFFFIISLFLIFKEPIFLIYVSIIIIYVFSIIIHLSFVFLLSNKPFGLEAQLLLHYWFKTTTKHSMHAHFQFGLEYFNLEKLWNLNPITLFFI